jgi:DNA primase
MARVSLEARAIAAETAAQFRLGYAPAEWDGLARFLDRRGASLEDAAELGLIVPRRSGKGYYDRFRHRLMFPIADVHGRIIAFSGRALPTPPGEAPPEEPPAKYINSPEGPLYKKGEVLYGLHEGRVEIRRRGVALLCEGNFDLVALHQAGFPHAIAPMGTAFTESHARLLRRFAERALLLFDGDAAGRRAVRAAYPLLQKVGVSAQVVELPTADDPDSFLRSQGAERLQDRLANAPAVVPYLIDRAAADAAGDPQAKAQAIAELGPLLLAVENPVEIPLYVEKIARKFGITDLGAVRRQLQQGARRARNPARADEKPTAAEPSGVRKPPAQPFVPPPLQAELFCVILDNPELFPTDEAKNLSELLTNPDLRAIFQATSRMVERRGVIDGPELMRALEGNPAAAWLEGRLARQDRQDLGGAKQILRDGIPRLAQQNIERELPRVSSLVLDARRTGDEALATALTQELVELTRTAHKLKQGSTKR